MIDSNRVGTPSGCKNRRANYSATRRQPEMVAGFRNGSAAFLALARAKGSASHNAFDIRLGRLLTVTSVRYWAT